MNGYSPKNISLDNNTSITYGASLTDEPISRAAAIYASGSIRLRVDVVASSVTVGTGITAKLQQLLGGSWTDVASTNASVAITADGVFSMTLLVERAADQPDLPLGDQVRVVLTSGAGDTADIDKIELLQGL